MGLRHEAKKGTTISVNGVKVTVVRGSPLLDIAAPADIGIVLGKEKVLTKRRKRPNNTRGVKHRS